jgi:uncharacterized spore protein YtfJ
MKIITPNGTTDTTKDSVVLMFNNDDDLSSFISLLVNIPVKTTGIRVLPLVPSGKQLSPLMSSILAVIQEMDGIGGKDNEKICDNVTESIKKIINK